MIEQGVILAAGMGTRIREGGVDMPKPLHVVAGVNMLKRTIMTMRRGGLRKVFVVVGFRHEELRAAVHSDPDYANADVEVEFIQNDDYKKANGVSLLKVKERVQGSFVLSMSDHVYDPELIELAARSDMDSADLWLCVDKRVATVYDLDDCTKVKTADDRIVDIGKQIPEYDCIDCGVFAIGQPLLAALDDVYAAKGDASLSEGVKHLARNGRARVADIGTAFWQDVDTVPAQARAEKEIIRALRKPGDGPVARVLNRTVSLKLTSLLLYTPVTPNQLTVLANIVGWVGVALVALGGWTALALGAVLVQLHSILDGCDGEIARLKFKETRFGQWLDTVTADLVNVAYGVALGFAATRLHGEGRWRWIALGAAGLMALYTAVVYVQVARVHKTGNRYAFRWWFQKDGDWETTLEEPSLWKWTVGLLRTMARRDVYIFVFMLLVLLRQIEIAVMYFAVNAVGHLVMTVIHLAAGGIGTAGPLTEKPARVLRGET